MQSGKLRFGRTVMLMFCGLTGSTMRALIFLLVMFAPVLAVAQQAPVTALHALFDREWDWQMQQNPAWASELGDRRWNDRWPDVSLQAIESRHQHHLAVVEELKHIGRAALTPADQLNYDLFLKQ